MLGAIIGDIVGSPFEHHNIKSTEFPLFSQWSRFTDDTVMTIAVCKGLLESYGNPAKSRESIINALQEYGRHYPEAGYGRRFKQWINYRSREPYGSFGNGSAMRVSSVAWVYDSLPDVEEYAEISAAVTHDHPEGIKGAKAVAGAIFLARSGKSKSEIAGYVSSNYEYDLSFTLDEIRPHYHFDVTCQGSVPQSIRAFLESDDFVDALRKAVSIGGDSDTIAAITGSIAEAYYGDLPTLVWEQAEDRLDARLRGDVELFRNWRSQNARG